MSRQSRTSMARPNQKHKTTQNPPKSLLPSRSARGLDGELFNYGLGRESLTSASRPRLSYPVPPLRAGLFNYFTIFPLWGLIVVAPDSIGVVNAVQRRARTNTSPVPFQDGSVQRVTLSRLAGCRALAPCGPRRDGDGKRISNWNRRGADSGGVGARRNSAAGRRNATGLGETAAHFDGGGFGGGFGGGGGGGGGDGSSSGSGGSGFSCKSFE
jgi:hypothetical protein